MPYKYEVKINDKSYYLSKDELEKNGGMGDFAKEYPGATIRMKRDADGKEFDIPVSEYDWATSRNMRPWVAEFKTVVKQPEKTSVASNEGVSQSSDSAEVSSEVYDAPSVDSVSQTAPKPMDERGYVFNESELIGDEETAVEKEPGVSNANQETAKSDKTSPKWTENNIYKNFVDNIGKSPISNYADEQLGAMRQEINTPEQANIPTDESGNEYYPAGVDVVEMSVHKVGPVLKELATNTRDEVRKAVQKKYQSIMMKGGGQADFSRDIAEETAPSKIIEAALEKVRTDDEYKKMIESEAKRLEVSVEDYIKGIVVPTLQNELYSLEIEARRPKNAGEYFLRRAVGGSMFGMMNSLAKEPLETRQLNEAAMQSYSPSTGEEIAGTFGSIVMDLPVMALTGGLGSAAGKGVLIPTVERLMGQGVSRAVAMSIATRAAQKNALGYGVRVASEAVNFGALEGLGSVIGQAYMTGDVDVSKVGAAFGKGLATGATMGIFGIGNEALGRTFTNRFGEKVGKVATYGTSLGGRTAVLTGSSVVGQWMEDPNFDINNVDWTNEFVHAGLINIGFDVIGVMKRVGKDKNIRPDDLYLTKENIRQLNDAGFKGKSAAEIAENLLRGRLKGPIADRTEKGVMSSEQKGVSQEGDGLYSEVARLMQNESIDLSTKSKIAYLMTGMVYKLSPNTSISDVIDANGEFIVEKYNTAGQTNEQRRFKNKSEAEQYIRTSQSEIKSNQVKALEEMMLNAGKVASATSLFDFIAKENGITRQSLMDIYVRGRKGSDLDARERAIYKTTSQLLANTIDVKNYHYDISEIKTELEKGYGKKEGWMDKVLKKKYNDLNETERRAYDEYIMNMQLRLQGNKAQEAWQRDYSERINEQKLLGSGGVKSSSGADAPITPFPSGSDVTEGTGVDPSLVEGGRAVGRELYAEHDVTKMRRAYLRALYSMNRLRSVAGDDVVTALDRAESDAEFEAIISSLPEEYKRYASDYVAQRLAMDGLDEALDARYSEDAALAESVVSSVFDGGKRMVPIARLDDNSGIVVLNGIESDGSILTADGSVMGVRVPLVDGMPDWKSFDASAVRSYRIKDEDVISTATPNTVTEVLLADKLADEASISTASPISVGAQFPVLLDGELRDVRVAGQNGQNWLVEVSGEKGFEAVSPSELELWKHQAEMLPIEQEYQEIDNKAINNDKGIGEESRVERNEADDAVGVSPVGEGAHEVGVQERPEVGFVDASSGGRARPSNSGGEDSVSGAVEEVPGNGVKASALSRLAVYPDGHAKAGRPDYESSRVEDVRDYLVESLGEEKALKAVNSTIAGTEGLLAEKADRARRLREEVDNSSFEVDDMLRAQHDVDAADAEVATLQKSVDYWKEVRTALGGEIGRTPSLIDVVRTLYTKGKDVASKLFQRSFFDVAQTPKFMHELGLRGDKFTIKYGVIARHLGKDSSHTLTVRDWEQLPQSLQNPFAISKLTDKEDSYRIYTTLLTESGEFVVVGADVKNTGREIEVNAVSTVFGRRNNANLPKNEEVIYKSNEITPEQLSLLERPNFAQYPTEQELSSKDVPSASKDNAMMSDMQEKVEESLPPLDKKIQRRINAAQTREKNRLSVPKEWSELTKAKKEYASYPEIIEVLNMSDPSDGFELAAEWLSHSKITPESFKHETGYGLSEQRQFVGMIARAENGGVSIERAAELLMDSDDNNYYGGDDYNARHAIITVLGEVNSRADLLHYIDNRRISEAERMYNHLLHEERSYLNEITMRDYDMSVDEYEADRELWNDYMDEVIEERLSGWENFRDSEAYFDLFDIFALESKTEENGREDTRNVMDGREKGLRDDIGNESAGVRESGSSLQGRGIGARTAIAEGNELRDSGGRPEGSGTFEPSNSVEPSVSSGNVAFESGGEESRLSEKIASAESEVNTTPSEGQKKAGNYKKGHVQIGSFNVTIEQPKGSVRSGVDKDGKKWSTTMQNTYGYIRGTEGVDGDHIDVFLSDDIDGWDGRKVFVVDQYNPDGSFDEHKVMLGFNDIDNAYAAYLSNYEEGWSDSRKIVIRPSTLEDFEKWINSSHRKTKPFSEYKNVIVSLRKNNKELNLQLEKDSNDGNRNNTPIGGQISEPISQGEHRAQAKEIGELEETATRLRERIAADARASQAGLSESQREVENRITRSYAKEQGTWIPLSQVFDLGTPTAGGNEHDNYLNASEGVIYKVNNRMNTPSIPDLLDRMELHNQTFPETKYSLVGFTSISDKGDVLPVFSQSYIPNARVATTDEIDAYMGDLGFTSEGDGRYSNGQLIIKDLHPRNVLVDKEGDVYVVDAEFEESKTPYHISPSKYVTKKGKELSMHLVTFAKDLSKEQYKAAKEIAKSDKGWYDAKKGGFMMRSEASAKDLAERVVSEGAAPIAEAQPSKVEDDKYKPVWEYHVSVDKETGRTTLSRDDVSGIIPIGDGRFKVYADSPEEMLDILRNPLNRMDEVLKEVEVTLENKIKIREFEGKNKKAVESLEEAKKTISFEGEKEPLKEIDNGRRIEKENSGLRKESGQEVERAERRGDVGGLHGNNVSDTSGGGRVSVGDGEQLTSVARVNNSRNYSFGENHLDLPTGEIGKLKGNIEAIRLLKELEESGRVATDAEKEVLRQFVGWGGLSESLNEDEYSRWQRYQKINTWDGIPGSTPWGKKYGSHYEALRPLLSDEEFKQAQASTLNSHYTPEAVIRGMWSALEQLGFKGGDILEPAMGIGHMIGFMPREISERSTIFGYELDSIPGRIARQLYPDAFIEVAGYETSFRPNSKDAVVTNVPFGQTAPIDPSLDKTLRKKLGSSYNLHNYFIVKGLLELRPGGVGAFVTSSSTMDGRNSKAREYISSLGVDLVGAIRLPNTAFKSNAGTEVTADLLLFRKRYPGEAGNGISFVSLSEIGKGHYIGKDKHGNDMLMEVPLLVNEYFATHPEMMLGEMMTAHDAGSGGLYGGDSQTLVGRKGADLGVELMTAISHLPENILTSRPTSTTVAPKERTSVKDGVLSVKDGKVYVSDSGVQSEVTSGTFKHDGKVRSYADAAKDYLTLKESLKDLIRAEQTETADPVALRSRVNSLYDDFVSKYGRLNENRALNVILEEDVERFLPQSLEKVETVYDASGRRRKVVSKADGILLRRVSQPMKAPEKADNLQDAIDVSQSYYGRMDINYISKLLNITPAEARERILSERQGYEDPLTGDLIDRDAYLSGNVREKLNVAREAAARDERFSINVSDLEQSLPETIPFVDISYKLGTPWIPEGVYQEFARDVLGLNGMSIRYVPVADEFMITGGHTSDYTKANEYNTPHRDAIDIFTDAINMRKPTIYRQVDRNTRVKDEAATQEVVAKIVDMNDAFVRYIQEKSDVHSELQRIYNERYNNYRLREYRFPQFTGTDGKIHYPGSNESIALRDHQTKAVQRSLQGSTLLAHQVGTGKTFTMITTAMEMRRLGLAKKPMIVVQNATLQDFASDFMKLYPGANILVPDENERSAKHRKRLFNLIATGDFDAIIVPQSFLAFIPDDPGRKKALIEQRVEEIMQAAEQLDDRRMADRLRREAKALSESISVDESTAPTRKTNVKKQAKKEESALARETRKLDRRTDDVLTFEQMGVDALFIDEAHNFKKIGFTTKMQNVKGIDTGYSERANSLLLKASYVQERNGGRNVILATGTPITNTMAEVWTMMRFVAPEILEDYGIKTFDEFAATFGQVEPSLEQNSTGGFKISDRFKSYVNVPELVKAFRSHADVVLTSDVPEFKKKNSLPRLKDDKMTNHVIHKSDALEDVMNVLVEALKADEQKTGKEKTPGLPLVVFSKAKQAAIDLRLINPSYPDDPNSKTNKVVSEVLRVYKESAEQKGIQMVFCDSYQSPEKEPAIDLFDFDPSVPRFNLYRDIKEKLIAGGIPKDEIVIVNEITSAERKKAVFEKARQGEVRVLIGGTEKMGVGVNVQDRMVALHHMDAPIRPMDFEQRNGRILRQGNMYASLDKPVEILTYGVEGTLDATAYDRLRIKQNFINQMMKGDVSGRVMEDNADDDPSGKTFSQMAAELSGDKTLQLLFVAENKLKKLAGLKRSHEIKKQYDREEIPLTEKTISIRESYLEKMERLAERAAKQFPNGIERISLNGQTFTDKLSKVLSEGVGMYEEQYKENRGIAPLSVKLNKDGGELLFYHNNGTLMYKLSLGKEDVVSDKEINTFAGIWPSVNSALSGLSRRVDDARKDVSERKKRLTGLRSVVQKSFDKEAELEAARAEVSALRSELEKKAQESATVTVDDSVVKEKLRGGRATEVSEPLANYDEVSLYRMENMINDSRSVAVNAPAALVVKNGRDIVDGMPGLSTVEMAFVMQECQRRDVCAMYVPKTRQILILPGHGTAREMRDAYWHESLHYGVDMVLPKGDYGKLLLSHGAKDVDMLDPELSRWVEEHYTKDVAEEKIIHLLEGVISYLADKNKLSSVRGGLNFGPEHPVLNEVCNRLLKYLTDGKEIGDNSGNDVRDTKENYGENQEWQDESQSSDVFRGTYEGVGIKHSVLGGDLERSHLRRLKEGETSHVERLFKENKNFDFTSGERINSIEDVAYIFKNLEDESVENSFAVLVDKEGRPTVVHLGMGSYAYSLVNGSALQVAVSRIKPKKITFVHNHPSGTLKASSQDRDVLKKLKSTYGANVVTDGIIINLRSGKFGVYNELPYDSEYKDELSKVMNESAIKVYSFNKLAFSKNYDPSTLPLANNQEAVAEFISSQRLGERDKLGLLVCDQQLRVVGNVFLRESSLTEKNLNQVAQDVVYYTTAMGGTRPILFGNGIKGLSAKLYPLIDDVSLGTIKLTDVVELETVKEDEASYGGSEIETIINHSKADGTYMKAPNGQPTNLNEKQWAQVRTKAFKKWFGDWEKVLRIEKLRKSNPVEITGQEIEANKDLRQYKQNALEYGKSLRGEYTNADTGAKIEVGKSAIKEVLNHDYKNIEQLKSVAAIPQIIEKSTYIESVENEDATKNRNVSRYHYYVCGLKIGGIDYTVKAVIAEQTNGNRYYDHKLTQIEKGKLLDSLSGITTPGFNQETSPVSDVKDKRLLSILQTNSSKVVDENGEPLVMYHGTASDITSFDMYDGSLGKGAYFTSSWDEAAEYAMEKQGVDNIDELDESKVMEVFLNVRDEKNITHSRFSREDIEVLATSPTQIKSATENNGEYSGENLDIRYSLREKPRRKPGESLISYHRRVEEWKTEWEEAKRRREVETMGRNEFDDVPRPEGDEDFSSPSFLARLEGYRAAALARKSAARDAEMKEADEALYDPSSLRVEATDSDSSDRLSEDELREVRTAFANKMKEVKIPISKEQLASDIKSEIIERRRYIETGNLEDAIFVDELKKMAGKGKQGAQVLRDIPSYIEGTYEGTASDELKACAKAVSDWFDEVYNLLAQEGVLYDAPRLQNYVTHIWDWKRTPKQVQEAYSNWMNTMRLRSPYTRHRIVPSYAEGIKMGMVPKYEDITGIIMEYGHYATEVIANHRMLKFLMNFSVKVPGSKNNMPMDMPVIVGDKTKDASYSRMNHTALDGYKVLNIMKPYITPVFGDQKIIDPSHLSPLANKFVDAFWLASGSMKKMVLSFSFFHHGALTETSIAMDRPWGAMKTIAKDLIWDVLVKGNIPAMNDKAAARDAVNHLVSLGATQDYAAADVRNFTTRLVKFTKDKNIVVAKEAAQLLDFLNSGSDKLLWDIIHDGYKVASFRKMASEVRQQAEREGWSREQLDKTLDECGQLVNDTYGGLHFDILGLSPKTVRILRALLLSPDWTIATIRQALSPFGVGALYQQDSFWKRMRDNGLGMTLKETTPGGIRKKYGRQFWLTAMIFFYGLMNGLNAYFRIKDEDDDKAEADKMRELNPDYRSAYELAYPDGMRWFDYTMPGNALGHQTHLFTGHYSDGTESYVRWGKQFRELPELFFGRDGLSFPGPMIDKISGKVNPFLSTIFTLISGHSLNGFENKDMKNKKGWERDVARLYVLAKAWLPYSVPTQEDKDFMAIDLMMPSSKGMSPYKAIDYFKKAIMSGDSTFVGDVYRSVVLNGLDADKYFDLASRSLEAEAKKNMIEGIETVDDAVKMFDSDDNLQQRKRLLRYVEQQLGAQDFVQVERDEIVNRALDILSGSDEDVKASDAYMRVMTGNDLLEDYRMKKAISGLKRYYDDYKSLNGEDKDAAQRMYREKKRYIDGYMIATRYRSAISRLKKGLGKGDDEAVMRKIRELRKELFEKL